MINDLQIYGRNSVCCKIATIFSSENAPHNLCCFIVSGILTLNHIVISLPVGPPNVASKAMDALICSER